MPKTIHKIYMVTGNKNKLREFKELTNKLLSGKEEFYEIKQ